MSESKVSSVNLRPEALEDLLAILVVDDDELVRLAVQAILGSGGFEIVIASSGEQAVEMLNAADGKYRALVTDINLGPDKMEGWEVAKHAREISPEFPVVYMSARATGDWTSKGVPKSIMLSKPFAPAQLVTAVSQLLNSSAPLT
jgi:CheY-like chemotaxis protein